MSFLSNRICVGIITSCSLRKHSGLDGANNVSIIYLGSIFPSNSLASAFSIASSLEKSSSCFIQIINYGLTGSLLCVNKSFCELIPIFLPFILLYKSGLRLIQPKLKFIRLAIFSNISHFTLIL